MRHILLSLFAVFTPVILYCQSVGINRFGDPPHPGSILDVQADSAGVLLPRTDTMSISLPIDGMVIYDTLSEAFYFFREMRWVRLLDSGLFRYFYADRDGDGFGDPWSTIYAPTAPPGFVLLSGDCNDLDISINPYAIELCDDLDNNCDGNIDDIPCTNNGAPTCAASTFLGGICGDQGSGFITESGCGEGWFSFVLQECNVNTADLKVSISLNVPSNMDYDLALLDSDCSTVLATSSQGGNNNELISFTITDNPAIDNTRTLYVWVVLYSGMSCYDWTLGITGN